MENSRGSDEFPADRSPSPRHLHIETVTHGLVLVRGAARAPARGVIVGFHGYAQSAETMLADLERVRGLDAWTVVAIQGLHRFYTRGETAVVASWMTRQDREVAIADNVAYVGRAIEAAAGRAPGPLVVVGFSQGVAMAWRAAMLGPRRPDAIVMLAGDVPPDVDPAGAPPVLIGSGHRDSWYTPAKRSLDVARLDAAGVASEVIAFDGAHEWTDAFRDAMATWIDRR